MSDILDKMARITRIINTFNDDAFPGGPSPHPLNRKAMAEVALHRVGSVMNEDEPNLDITKPTASEVKQMIKEALDEHRAGYHYMDA